MSVTSVTWVSPGCDCGGDATCRGGVTDPPQLYVRVHVYIHPPRSFATFALGGAPGAGSNWQRTVACNACRCSLQLQQYLAAAVWMCTGQGGCAQGGVSGACLAGAQQWSCRGALSLTTTPDLQVVQWACSCPPCSVAWCRCSRPAAVVALVAGAAAVDF